MDLQITASVDDAGRDVLTVAGAIDLSSRTHLLDAGAGALSGGAAGSLVLELSGVTFMDSTGIGALVQLARETAETGRAFVIQNPSQRVTRTLEVTGLGQAWDIETASA